MRKGFTLVEMMVTIVIIGILITIGVVVYSGLNSRSKDRLYETKIALIQSKAENWASEMNLKDPMNISVNRLVIDGFLTADVEVIDADFDLQVLDPRDNRLMNCDIIAITFAGSNPVAKYSESDGSSASGCELAKEEIDDSNITLIVLEYLDSSGDKFITDTPIDATSDKEVVLPWTRFDVNVQVTSTYTVTNTEWYLNGNRMPDNSGLSAVDIKPSVLLNSKLMVVLETDQGLKRKAITVQIDKESPMKPTIKKSCDLPTGKWCNIATNGGVLELNIKSSDLGSGIKDYQYSMDNGATWTLFKDSTLGVYKEVTKNKNTITFTFNKDIKKEILVKVLDNVNNSQTLTDKIVVELDSTPPTKPTITPSTGTDTGGYDGSWANKCITIRLKSKELTSGVANFQYNNGGGWVNVPGTINYNSGTGEYYLDYQICDEQNKQWCFRVLDKAGNVSETICVTVRIDRTNPTIGVNPASVTIVRGNAYDVWTGVSSGDALSGVRSKVVSLRGTNNGRENVSHVLIGNSSTISTTGLGDGTYILTYMITDNAGNVITGTRTLNVVYIVTKSRYRTRGSYYACDTCTSTCYNCIFGGHIAADGGYCCWGECYFISQRPDADRFYSNCYGHSYSQGPCNCGTRYNSWSAFTGWSRNITCSANTDVYQCETAVCRADGDESVCNTNY